MADVSMGDVDVLNTNEGFPLEGAVDDSAAHDYSEFQGLSDELGEAAGYGETDVEGELEGEPGEEPGIDSSSFEGGTEEPEETKPPSPTAQKRIQSLANRNKALEEQVQQQNQYFQHQLATMQHQMMQQAKGGDNDAVAKQLQLQQQQLEMLSQQKQKEEYSNLSPLEQLKVDILKEATT